MSQHLKRSLPLAFVVVAGVIAMITIERGHIIVVGF